jgi:hypothetical protein
VSKQVLDRLPGETGTDFSRFVSEYLSNFKSYKIKKDYAQRDQLYEWCARYMGQQYKDWFVHEGGKYDKWWSINIRSPKHCTLFSLRWSDIILESVDRRSK